MEDIQRLQSNLSRLRDASSAQIQSLEEQLSQKTTEAGLLESQLAAQSDYEEMKRELSVVKMIEFSSTAASTPGSGGGAKEGVRRLLKIGRTLVCSV